MKLEAFLKDNLAVSKGSVKVPIGGMIANYKKQYSIITKVNKLKFNSETYHIKSGDRTIVHVKVPSETVGNFYYDVLIEFITNPKCKRFEDCDINIFSNAPSFVYRYAYVFYHLDTNQSITANGKGMMIDMFKHKIPREHMLVKDIEHKLGEQPLTEPPIVRNSLGLPLFDKTLYYAIFYILDNLNYINTIHKHTRYYTERQVVSSVSSFDALMLKRKQLERIEREKKIKRAHDIKKTYRSHENYINGKVSNAIQPIKHKELRPVGSVRKMQSVKSKGINKIGK